MCLPLFKGPKVMGQLAAQLFHGLVCVIPSLSHLQGADKKVQSSFQVYYLHLESVAVNSQYEIRRAVTISEASHHQALKSKQTHQRDSKNIRCAQIDCRCPNIYGPDCMFIFIPICITKNVYRAMIIMRSVTIGKIRISQFVAKIFI